jgi:hypothetical protein
MEDVQRDQETGSPFLFLFLFLVLSLNSGPHACYYLSHDPSPLFHYFTGLRPHLRITLTNEREMLSIPKL